MRRLFELVRIPTYRLRWIALLLLAGPALPQEPVKTVVTVTARPSPVATSAADLSVVEAEDAPSASPQSIADLLRFQPALYIGQTGQRGGLTSVSLRGGDA